MILLFIIMKLNTSDIDDVEKNRVCDLGISYVSHETKSSCGK